MSNSTASERNRAALFYWWPAKLLGWFTLREFPSWLASLCVHLTALILIALLQFGIVKSSAPSWSVTAGNDDGMAGMGDFDLGTSDGGQNGLSPIKGDEPAAADLTRHMEALELPAEAKAASAIPLADLSHGKPLDFLPPDTSGKGAGAAMGASGKSVGDGDGSKMGYGGTKFFGLAGRGRKFVYVFDRSESMSYQYFTEGPPNEFGNVPLRAAKEELLSSIYELSRQQQFWIVFYNHMPSLFRPSDSPGHPPLATAENKQRVRDVISELRADGGTNHLDALLMALRLQPDVIFLLTDGEAKDDLSSADLQRLREANKNYAVINVVQFAQHPRPTSTMVQLARENRGRHIFIDVTKVGELARKLNGKDPISEPDKDPLIEPIAPGKE